MSEQQDSPAVRAMIERCAAALGDTPIVRLVSDGTMAVLTALGLPLATLEWASRNRALLDALADGRWQAVPKRLNREMGRAMDNAPDGTGVAPVPGGVSAWAAIWQPSWDAALAAAPRAPEEG